jgi:hypothetical protein
MCNSRQFPVTVQDNLKHLLMRAYESVNHAAWGDYGYEVLTDA